MFLGRTANRIMIHVRGTIGDVQYLGTLLTVSNSDLTLQLFTLIIKGIVAQILAPRKNQPTGMKLGG